jgi:SAM-dependent methyltransferase
LDRSGASAKGGAMKVKSVELDLTALMSEVMFGHGYAHYGYFPDGVPEVLSASAMGAAQHAYFERLEAAIRTVPGGVTRVLDVGSGTGANARALIERGYQVACVSPSAQMNEMARAKLPEGTVVTDARFETFDTETRFDICLFAESFHYINLEAGLRQAARFAEKGVVIFDYFRRPGHEHRDGTRGTHADFCDALVRQGAFEIVSDEDLTEAITPTFVIHEHLKNEKIAPFVQRFRAALKSEYPWRAWALEKMLGRSLDKLGRKTGRAVSFGREHEYRLIVLKMTATG